MDDICFEIILMIGPLILTAACSLFWHPVSLIKGQIFELGLHPEPVTSF